MPNRWTPKRPIKVVGDLAYVTLTKGAVAVIDADDVDMVSGWNWQLGGGGRGYAVRHTVVDGKERNVLMHRVIAGTPDGFDTDHIDGDGLNNRRSNLRVVTTTQNTCNRRRSVSNTSGYKGVSFNRRLNKYTASIKLNGRQKHLGVFSTAEEAHARYCGEAQALHGQYSNPGDR